MIWSVVRICLIYNEVGCWSASYIVDRWTHQIFRLSKTTYSIVEFFDCRIFRLSNPSNFSTVESIKYFDCRIHQIFRLSKTTYSVIKFFDSRIFRRSNFSTVDMSMGLYCRIFDCRIFDCRIFRLSIPSNFSTVENYIFCSQIFRLSNFSTVEFFDSRYVDGIRQSNLVSVYKACSVSA